MELVNIIINFVKDVGAWASDKFSPVILFLEKFIKEAVWIIIRIIEFCLEIIKQIASHI